MEECPYDTSGILWRARADKAAVMQQEEEASSGVDSESEDINEHDFDHHYKQTLKGALPLLEEATRPPSKPPQSRAAAAAGNQRKRRRAPADAFAFDDASQQTQPPSYALTLVPTLYGALTPFARPYHCLRSCRAATYRVQDGGDSPPDGALVLGDPLASQTAFPFSQLPEMGWAEPPEVRDGGEDGGDAGDEGANNNKLPDFLTDLLDEKDNNGGQADSKRKGAGKGTPVLMYQLVLRQPERVCVFTIVFHCSLRRNLAQSQTDYLQDQVAKRKKEPTTTEEKATTSPTSKTKRPRD